jgi:drug/metabolite transporter (DMT)-like permease
MEALLQWLRAAGISEQGLGRHLAGVTAAPDLARSALAGLGVIALMFVLANLALQYGAARLPTRVTAVVMLSEVVFAAVSAVMLGGEALTLRMLVGAALILGASLLSALGPR